VNARIQYDSTKTRQMWRGISSRSKNLKPAFVAIHTMLSRQTGLTFNKLGKGTGTYRGQTWKPFADQYTRKTDGVTVPAWGGVKRVQKRRGKDGKLRAGGKVKGRKRNSGQRITRQSMLMQDKGKLRTQSTLNRRITRMSLNITVAAGYAKDQQKQRAFLFVDHPRETVKMTKMVGTYITRGRVA